MKCPSCGFPEDKVLDTRAQRDGFSIKRRRECLSCHFRYSTLESLLLEYPQVIKKDGRREDFSKTKILGGLQAACQKRPISMSQLEQTVEKVSRAVLERSEREIPSQYIGKLMMDELKGLDHVAYVRFASVYKTFKDVQEFVEELEKEAPLSDEGRSH